MINAVKNKERGYHKPGARVATLFINVLDLGYRLMSGLNIVYSTSIYIN